MRNQSVITIKQKGWCAIHMVWNTLLLFIILLTFTCVGYFLFQYKGGIYAWYREATIKIKESKLSDFTPANGYYPYDQVGKEHKKLSATEKNTYLNYPDIPEPVIHAFIAIEDREFWGNKGYDLKGILRILYRYLTTGGKTIHGASTITQQLARLIYLSSEISVERKLKEILYAIKITKKYSKQQIIEFYVNNCYFANHVYGIESASNAYFGARTVELSLSQIAYLCAIPNRPTYYNPYVDASRALVRRNKILQDMETCGYISNSELSTALNETITIVKNHEEMGAESNR